MPLVSIITSTYNRPRYLKEAIESVLAQTFQDWELIVVNDGSTDDTEGVIEAYARQSTRIRAIHQPHRGLSGARNAALQKGRSPYVAFLDDDDVWMRKKLKNQVDYFLTYPETGLLFSQAYLTDETLAPREIYPTQWDFDFETLIEWKFWIPFSSVMLRRDCLERVGLFDEQLTRSVDYDLWLRIRRFFPFGALAEPLIYYRQHRTNMSREAKGRHRAHIVSYQKVMRYPEFLPYSKLIQRRIAREYYELGRIYRHEGDYPRAAGHFVQSISASPSVGTQLREYHSGVGTFVNWIRPYLAAGYCLSRGLFKNGLKKKGRVL